MLKVAGPLILLACLALTAPAHAQDKRDAPKAIPEAGLCAPVCASARQDCRAQAQGATENDGSPILSMKASSNPYVAAGKETLSENEITYICGLGARFGYEATNIGYFILRARLFACGNQDL